MAIFNSYVSLPEGRFADCIGLLLILRQATRVSKSQQLAQQAEQQAERQNLPARRPGKS